MIRFKKLLLSVCTAAMVAGSAFPAMAEVEKNTLEAEINGTDYTFYLDKAVNKEYLYLGYYTLNSHGDRGLRLGIMNGATGKGKWSMVFQDTAATYAINGKYMDVDLTSTSNDGKTATGTLEVDYEHKGESVRIKDGEFNFTLGEKHSKLAELDSSGVAGLAKSSGSGNKKSNSSGSSRSASAQGDEYCSYCGGLGECDECLGSGSVSCESCFGSGNCQRCYGQGGEDHYTGLDVRWIKCSSCNGLGTCKRCKGTGEKKCTQCNGSGNCRYCGGDGVR